MLDLALHMPDWVQRLIDIQRIHITSGWEFAILLRDGLDEIREELGPHYVEGNVCDELGTALGKKGKTLQNMANIARKPWTKLAMELELEIGHADAVSGLDDEVVEDMLQRAAEQMWTVAFLRREVYMSKQDRNFILATPTPANGIAYEPAYEPAHNGIAYEPAYEPAHNGIAYEQDDPEYQAVNLLTRHGKAWCAELVDELQARLIG